MAKTLAQIERAAILEAVRSCGGDKKLAAERLAIGKTTLYRKLKLYERKPRRSRAAK
jgi:DNA-binding NtrC family response regulator